MSARDYLKRILRDVPRHPGYPHEDLKNWLFCKLCGPKYQLYLKEKERLKQGKYSNELVLPEQFKM